MSRSDFDFQRNVGFTGVLTYFDISWFILVVFKPQGDSPIRQHCRASVTIRTIPTSETTTKTPQDAADCGVKSRNPAPAQASADRETAHTSQCPTTIGSDQDARPATRPARPFCERPGSEYASFYATSSSTTSRLRAGRAIQLNRIGVPMRPTLNETHGRSAKVDERAKPRTQTTLGRRVEREKSEPARYFSITTGASRMGTIASSRRNFGNEKLQGMRFINRENRFEYTGTFLRSACWPSSLTLTQIDTESSQTQL
jgi:hypothetical protein